MIEEAEVHEGKVAAATRLHDLGVDEETLREAVEYGLRHAFSCTKHDPPNLPGIIAWGKGIRSLRDRLVPLGWTTDNSRNYATVVSPDGKTALPPWLGMGAWTQERPPVGQTSVLFPVGLRGKGMNPNDEIRRKILRYFYDRNASATSRTGKKGSAVKISDVKRELKEVHGLTQPQVMSNLTYLIDMGWVKTFDVEKQVGTKGGTLVPSSVTWYEITAPGIDKIDGESEFTPPSRFAGVNISATGTNVITMGDGNVVNVDHRELHAE